jgi:hypothetical protein
MVHRRAPSEAAACRSGSGDHEEHGVEYHERNRAKAVAEPQRGDRNPGNAGEHGKEAEQRREKARNRGTQAHGDAERDADHDREHGSNGDTPEAGADVAQERPVLNGFKPGARDRLDVREHPRIDVERANQRLPQQQQEQQRCNKCGGCVKAMKSRYRAYHVLAELV